MLVNHLRTNRKTQICLTLLCVGVAIIVFGWKPLLVARYTPDDRFEPNKAPVPVDYIDMGSWAAHPKKWSSALLEHEALDSNRSGNLAAVFYVYPTTYFAGDAWNWKPTEDSYAQQGIEHAMATQASVFNECCDIYAPYYRQAHIIAFGDGSDASLEALDLAFEDVDRAFSQFLAEIGPDTPFFIAGHSQGSAHLQRLLSARISGQELQDRLITAYLIGYWLPADVTTRSFPDVSICETAESTGCFVTWDSYDRGADEMPFFSVPHWFSGGWGRLEEVDTACVNPLNWRTSNDLVTREYNLGAIESQPAGGLFDIIMNRNPGHIYESIGPALPAATSAECLASGKLLTDSQFDNEFQRSGHGESGSYHAFDWNLFYLNIRENVDVRLQSWRKQSS